MRRVLPIICAAMLLATGAAFAQSNQNPTPSQAGADPSMAKPEGSTQPALRDTAQPVHNPESTVGLAPADQPVNNEKPNVAGEVVPSSQETAAHNPSIFEHDRQPTLTHTFNFTPAQKQAIVAALAQEKGMSIANVDLAETTVVPDSVELKPIPDRIAQEMPWVKPYFYVKTDDRIVIVNPLARYVAAVIE
jgi:hypothetical protein